MVSGRLTRCFGSVILGKRGDRVERAFVCSLCHNGILGGALYLTSDSLIYKTNKLTVHPKFRNLVLPIRDVLDITWKWLLFPVATFRMSNVLLSLTVFVLKRIMRNAERDNR